VTCGASSSGKRYEGDKLAPVQTVVTPFRFPARLSRVDNEIGVSAGGPVIGGNRNYWRAGVHDLN